MAALLVAMSVMAVLMTMAMPVWQTAAKREREAELVFRGEQYARAIALFQRKYANALPPSFDVLVNERFLRKKYLDPMTGKAFEPLSPGSLQANAGVRGGLVGRPGGASGSTSTAGRTGGSAGPNGAGSTTTSGAAGGGSGQSSFSTSFSATTSGGRLGGVAGGIMGVTSTSAQKSLRLYNGRGAYNEWTFVPVQRTAAAGVGGVGGAAGVDGRGGRGTATPGRGSQPGSGAPPGSRGFGGGNGGGRSFRPTP
jgi:type II secretory pathway pseudopilin PulG